MSKSLSIFLDLLRFTAAIAVVLFHFTEGEFSSGIYNPPHSGLFAVSAFFVLSGFVISYVVSRKENDALTYTVARISRLYSVLVPAVLLSGLALLIGHRMDAAYFDQWSDAQTNLHFLHAHPTVRFLAQSVLSLTFLNSIHNHDAYPAMNIPIWSLGFEGPFYAIFGIFLFNRGARRVLLLAVCCLIFGGGILRLLPVWLAGVALHRLTQRITGTRMRDVVLGVVCLAAGVAGFLLWPSFELWANEPHGALLGFALHGSGRAALTYLFYYWGAVTSLLIIAAAGLERALQPILLPLERPIRWCAGHTFSIYLFHFPLFALAYAVTHYERASRLTDSVVFCAVMLLCVALSTISESKKLWWRDRTRQVLAPLFPVEHREYLRR